MSFANGARRRGALVERLGSMTVKSPKQLAQTRNRHVEAYLRESVSRRTQTAAPVALYSNTGIGQALSARGSQNRNGFIGGGALIVVKY
jgi:hypothetical protein